MSRRTLTRRLPALAALVPLAVLVSGCSSGYKIDHKKAETLLTQGFGAEGLKVASATCPSGLAAKKGARFGCTITGADGTTGKVTFLETNDKGHVVIVDSVVNMALIQKQIAQWVTARSNVQATVLCPDVVTLVGGAAFTCKATGGGSSLKIAVSADAKKHITWRVA